jgi:hypothetical protein
MDQTFGLVALSLDQLQLRLCDNRSGRATNRKLVTTGYELDHQLRSIAYFAATN